MNVRGLRRQHEPISRNALVDDLRQLGVEPGDVLLVNSAVSAMGWIDGGVQAVIEALQTAVGAGGTIVMPAFNRFWSDPATWTSPTVPETWWDAIRETLPAYDPDLTPTHLGSIPECFRKARGAVRSRHPQSSFVAWGRHAEYVVADHDLLDRFGPRSPLGRIYELDGSVLLLGVGFIRNTSLHLAESITPYPGRPAHRHAIPMPEQGGSRWIEHTEVLAFPDELGALGLTAETAVAAQEKHSYDSAEYRHGTVGLAESILFPQRTNVDFLCQWLQRVASAAERS